MTLRMGMAWFYSRQVAEGALVIDCPACGAVAGHYCFPNYEEAKDICTSRLNAFLVSPRSAELRAKEHAREVF